MSVFFNASTPYEATHMILAAYMVTGFVVAGVYAVGLLRGRRDRYHRLGFGVPFTIAGIAAPLQVMMGDVIARFIAHNQPVKFAAMEYVLTTQKRRSGVAGRNPDQRQRLLRDSPSRRSTRSWSGSTRTPRSSA